LFDVLTLGPTPIQTAAGHARPLEETDAWLMPILDRVPVTRVYDATALDTLGLPVWAAVTPLAKDLTVHAGKGASALAARISAVMEAIERVSAEDVAPSRVRTASYDELRAENPAAVLDPTLFDLPFRTGYDERLPISWIEGYDLIADRAVWVALDLVISPAREGVCTGVETNGLAAGNCHTEAVVHALYEVIERDALARERFCRLYADLDTAAPTRVVAPASLPTTAADWAASLSERGVRLTVHDLTHDLDVPVFRATLTDRSFPGREGRVMRFDGLGAELNASRAVTRAISEAAQSHTVTLVGARDTFEDGRAEARHSPAGLIQQLLFPSTQAEFRDLPGGADDLRTCMLMLLDRIERVGLRHVVVVDLTDRDLGVPVVRVLVPGAAGPYGETARRPPLRLLRSLV
jgi:ribosomal protein S12 methylthiotransferase accessory factor